MYFLLIFIIKGQFILLASDFTNKFIVLCCEVYICSTVIFVAVDTKSFKLMIHNTICYISSVYLYEGVTLKKVKKLKKLL